MMNELNKIILKLKAMQWSAILITLSISFLCASILASGFTYILMPKVKQNKPDTNNLTLNQSLPVLNNESLSKEDLDIIYKRNIFNHKEKLSAADVKKEDTPEINKDKLFKSNLPLKVLGIIYGGTPYNGLATILNTTKKRANSFVVGDILEKNAEIVAILYDKVIFKIDDRYEYIELAKKEIVRSRRKQSKTKSSSNTISPIAMGPAPENYKEEGFERKGHQIKMSMTYKNKLLGQDFTKVLQDAKASPNIENGRVKGFRLTRIRENSIYQKSGLQNNDVIEEINGVPLSDAAGAIRLLQSLKNESDIDITVNRNGRSFNMNLNVQ